MYSWEQQHILMDLYYNYMYQDAIVDTRLSFVHPFVHMSVRLTVTPLDSKTVWKGDF